MPAALPRTAHTVHSKQPLKGLVEASEACLASLEQQGVPPHPAAAEAAAAGDSMQLAVVLPLAEPVLLPVHRRGTQQLVQYHIRGTVVAVAAAVAAVPAAAVLQLAWRAAAQKTAPAAAGAAAVGVGAAAAAAVAAAAAEPAAAGCMGRGRPVEQQGVQEGRVGQVG
jgi:hypothetical protein